MSSMHSALAILTPRMTRAVKPFESPSLMHLLSPKWLSAKARPLGKTENKAGRLVLFFIVGAVFWVFVFGLLYRLPNTSAAFPRSARCWPRSFSD